ncbi:chemotaxis protein CheB [Pigmentiphaga aceris]|uniref:protein-glutamate methylesterase n=1 Tax=Pigmentiphaga aceris TaxID=1940612 RepID=A0A5C0B0N6_9BURK|nr:chemotaxis protein CheB [Pigmentiphaga aceris]QEI08299.1 chemotaxis protein CheB [Pigmentiphaga aceris]
MNASTKGADVGANTDQPVSASLSAQLACPYDAIVIGASTGGIDALGMLLPALPAALPASVMVVVHIPPQRDSLLPSLFQGKCALPVTEAESREPIRLGHVYFAPPDYHLMVESDRTWALSHDALVHYSRPSIDVLFETAAWSYGPRLLGILLTGANEDGARGMQAIAQAGGTTWAQSPDTALASVMPQSAIALGSVEHVLSLSQMASRLRNLCDTTAMLTTHRDKGP